MIDLMDALNIEGSRALLFVAGDDGTAEEAPEDMAVDDPAVCRREQWIVSGDQYVFTWKDKDGVWHGPELGEFEADGPEQSGKIIDALEDLVPLVRRRLDNGEPARNMHPVLLQAVITAHVREALAHRIGEDLGGAAVAVQSELERRIDLLEASSLVDRRTKVEVTQDAVDKNLFHVLVTPVYPIKLDIVIGE